jgi:exopolysaccharide biosynthesis polyprenyl glycosylphosphotransferase
MSVETRPRDVELVRASFEELLTPGVVAADQAPRLTRRVPQWLVEYQSRIILTDVIVISLAVAASIKLRWGVSSADLAVGVTWTDSAGVAVVIGLLWALALKVNGAWDKKILGAGISEYRRIFNASCGVFLLLVTASYLLRADLSRGYVAILLPLGLSALVGGRLLARASLRTKRRLNESMSNVLVIGSERSAPALREILTRSPNEGMRVTGVYIPRHSLVASETNTADERDRLRAAIQSANAHLVAIAPAAEFSPDQVRALAWELEGTGIGLALAPALTDVAGPRVHIKPVAGLPLMYVEEPRFRGPKLIVKTALDGFGAIALLTITAPIMLAVAFLIKREDGGPIFFQQQRVGLDGKTFKVIKFRSMVPNAHKLIDQVRERSGQADQVFYKSAGDDRITRVGRFLRKTSLDELPQLFNVFSGDMSLVGPRPLVPGEGAGVGGFLERRMLVKPGLTGLWQVSGRSDVTGDERVRLDLFYVENWSLAGDLTILARTVKTVLKREGAY